MVDDSILQKTWSPEGTREYKTFKSITRENLYLSRFLRQNVRIPEGRILDVGGRDGDITCGVFQSDRVEVLDPDPTLICGGRHTLIAERIQHHQLGDRKYALVVFSHVLGYLGGDQVQRDSVIRALQSLTIGGAAVLFYNVNRGAMGSLLEYSTSFIANGHYDYFDENILYNLDPLRYSIQYYDVTFEVIYPNFAELSRCCWFLFGNRLNNIEKVAAQFASWLQLKIVHPGFSLHQRIAVVRRQ